MLSRIIRNEWSASSMCHEGFCPTFAGKRDALPQWLPLQVRCVPSEIWFKPGVRAFVRDVRGDGLLNTGWNLRYFLLIGQALKPLFHSHYETPFPAVE